MRKGTFLSPDGGSLIEPRVERRLIGECERWTIAQTGQTIWPRLVVAPPADPIAPTAERTLRAPAQHWVTVAAGLLLLAVASDAVWLILR